MAKCSTIKYQSDASHWRTSIRSQTSSNRSDRTSGDPGPDPRARPGHDRNAAALVDEAGQPRRRGDVPAPQHHPEPGRVEHDAEEILRPVAAPPTAVLAASNRPHRGVGITNQRETIVLWERSSGRPVAPALVWQDGRTAERCAELVAAGAEELVRSRTGLPLQPYFSATKLAWLLDNVPGARERAQRGELAAGTIDAWLALAPHRRARQRRHERVSYAPLRHRPPGVGRRVARAVRRPARVLPDVVPSWRAGGHATITADGPAGRELPLLALLGDQQAALVGQGCSSQGDAKCTYGTGAFLLVNAGTRRPAGPSLLTSPAYRPATSQSRTASKARWPSPARAIEWLADELGLIDAPSESAAVADSVRLAAAFASCPRSRASTRRGGMRRARLDLGLTLHSTAAHVVRATLEALAFQTRVVVDAAEPEGGAEISELRIDGGATANAFLTAEIADALGRPVARSADAEATVRGAAFAAGLAAGPGRSTRSTRLRGRQSRSRRSGETTSRGRVRRLAGRRRAASCRGTPRQPPDQRRQACSRRGRWHPQRREEGRASAQPRGPSLSSRPAPRSDDSEHVAPSTSSPSVPPLRRRAGS